MALPVIQDDYRQPALPAYRGAGWFFNSIDTQVITKSTGNNGRGQTERLNEIQELVTKGANFAATAMPYDDATVYGNWVTDIRTKGLKVYHRSHWNAWEGDNSVGNIATSTSLTRSGSTATCVTQTAHGMQTGDTVSMNGMNETEYRGVFTITVINSTTFTYPVSGTPATPATGNIGWRYACATYLRKTYQFIIDNPSFFAAGDMFGMCVEAQQADSQSMTFKTPGTTVFDYTIYNQFLKDQVNYANAAFRAISLGNQIYTFPISFGVSNLNLNGQTLDSGETGNSSGLGNADIVNYFGGFLTIDHYLSDTYRDSDNYGTKYLSDVNKIHTAFPSCKIMIGEWGYHTTTVTTDVEQDTVYADVVTTALLQINYLLGVNFWNHLGQTQSSLWTDVAGTIVTGGRLATRQVYKAFMSWNPSFPNNAVTRSGNQFVYNGSRFRFVGMNYYPFIVESTTASSIQNLFRSAKAKGIKVFRTWCFDAGAPPTNSAGNFRYESGGVLNWREATFVQLDTLLDYAKQYGIKLILSLADNPTYLTKRTYCEWANTIYSSGLSTAYPYIGFFQSADCKTIYKQFIDKLVTRVNTINGRTYGWDDTIFSWELGNELRTDNFEGVNVNTINSENLILLSKTSGWADEMSTYIKSVDPNHMVAFSSCSHGYLYTTGDTVWNGTFYGVDYNIISALTNIDYMDCHVYPTQGGGEVQLLKYGQHLGYADAISAEGFRAQLQDYVTIAKANSKPCIIGETGFVKEVFASTQYYPLFPRHNAFKDIFDTFFGAGGDGVCLWSATYTSGGSYSVVLSSWNGSYSNANSDDRPLMNIITRRNFYAGRIPASSED